MFNPIDFFYLARTLIKEEEASARTSIGRAYYASFLIARDKFGFNLKTPEVYQKVIEELYRRRFHTIATKLHSLRRLRNSSDYDTKIKLSIAEPENALELADSIINRN